jgi:hypothetical protein
MLFVIAQAAFLTLGFSIFTAGSGSGDLSFSPLPKGAAGVPRRPPARRRLPALDRQYGITFDSQRNISGKPPAGEHYLDGSSDEEDLFDSFRDPKGQARSVQPQGVQVKSPTEPIAIPKSQLLASPISGSQLSASPSSKASWSSSEFIDPTPSIASTVPSPLSDRSLTPSPEERPSALLLGSDHDSRRGPHSRGMAGGSCRADGLDMAVRMRRMVVTVRKPDDKGYHSEVEGRADVRGAGAISSDVPALEGE